MSVLVDFVKFLLSFRNRDTTSFKNTKKIYFIGTLTTDHDCDSFFKSFLLKWIKNLGKAALF